MRRELPGGYELDDDPGRIDREAVHRYLSGESYWAQGRARVTQDALIDNAARVVGLYHGTTQVGFSRAISDGHVQSYLADVYVRFSVDEGPLAGTKWILHTADAHGLYRKLGFVDPGSAMLERPRRDASAHE
jgi:hypothetical protein